LLLKSFNTVIGGVTKGVQCKEEVRESVTWSRTPAITEEGIVAELSVPCPGYTITDNSSGTIIRKYTSKYTFIVSTHLNILS